MKKKSLFILMLVTVIMAGLLVACPPEPPVTPTPESTQTVMSTPPPIPTPPPTPTPIPTPIPTLKPTPTPVPTLKPTPTPVPQIPTSNLVLTMEFDDASPGYVEGNIVRIQFKENNRFVLSDKFGTFNGDYSYTGEKLTLDFDSYPAWYITFIDDTYFEGIEAGENDAGTYVWQ